MTERLSAIIVAAAGVGFGVYVWRTLPYQAAFILSLATVLAYVGWIKTTYAHPVRSRSVIAVYLCAVGFQLLHMIEEYTGDFAHEFVDLFDSPRDWSEKSFLLTFVFAFGAIYFFAGAAALYQIRIADFFLWWYALGAGLLNAIAHFVFPILKGGYFPGVYTAGGHLILSGLLIYLLLRENRQLRSDASAIHPRDSRRSQTDSTPDRRTYMSKLTEAEHEHLQHDAGIVAPSGRRFDEGYILAADRIFDGTRVLEQHAVAIAGDRIAAVAPADRVPGPDKLVRFAGTLLPGFIDLHAHLLLDQIPKETILRHGITTVRDTGGPLVARSGGDGRLRVLGAGPILTAPGGYPIPVFGPRDVGLEVPDVQTARTAVSQLVAGGAAVIKVALEPGGSPGAPWTGGHQPTRLPPWPILSPDVLRAIVDEAHDQGLTVAAHLSGPQGATLALDAGVDEWAHVPCDPLPHDLIARAAAAGVRVVSTLDTQSHCTGVTENARKLLEAGIRLLYGTDMAHPDVPWGINAHELQLMLHAGHGALSPLDVLSAATARAGDHLGLAPLGRLVEGAPADLIGVLGDPFERFKTLEYPDLVVSGGATIIDPAAH